MALATIPAAVKRELHTAAAAVCDERDLPIEVRALHELAGGTSFQALLLLERVSVAASARGDHQGAIMALRRALDLARRELFRGELDDPMRAVLIFSRKLGEVLARGRAVQRRRRRPPRGARRRGAERAGPRGGARRARAGRARSRARGRTRAHYLREALELATSSGAHELVASLETLRRSMAS